MDGAPAFRWLSYGRFVEVVPVVTGWLVLWGRYEGQGRVRRLAGSRVYRDLDGARGRIVDAVLDLTNDPRLATEATARFDRAPFPAHPPAPLPDPL